MYIVFGDFMVIDMHTHVFPDNIAKNTIEILKKDASIVNMIPNTDGTKNGILKSMTEGNVDISIVLPVVTKVHQFNRINEFAQGINSKKLGIISFGGIHPKDSNINEHLEKIKSLGLLGIKIHPDYQETYFDDPGYLEILVKCYQLGLVVVTHAGRDPAYTDVHCSPKMGKEVLDRVESITKFENPYIVFAHMGGMSMYDDVENYLVGRNCYFDLSHGFEFCGHKQLLRIIKNHGVDKILFATDSPWRSQKDYICKLNSISELSDIEKDMIFSQNAKKLLSL